MQLTFEQKSTGTIEVDRTMIYPTDSRIVALRDLILKAQGLAVDNLYADLYSYDETTIKIAKGILERAYNMAIEASIPDGGVDYLINLKQMRNVIAMIKCLRQELLSRSAAAGIGLKEAKDITFAMIEAGAKRQDDRRRWS